MKKTALFVFSAAALVATLAPMARATVLYSTDFNAPTYSDGAIIGQDSWAITGTSTVNPINVANTATNGNVTLTTTGQDVNRLYTPTSPTSIYLSADINVASAGTGDYFIHLGDGSTSNFYDRVFVKSTGATTFAMALGTSSGTPAAGAYGANLNFGTTYHFVAEYDVVSGTANDTGALYINPTDPIFGDTPSSPSFYMAAVTQGADSTTPFSSVNLRQGGGAIAPVVTVDNIAVAVPVPEPATLLLSGLGMIGLVGIARRKRA